jgi:molybdopterin molybdotransferase
VALVDQPPFDKSAMDGFAYGEPGPLPQWRIVGVLAAGAAAGAPIGRGECVRIMTGAPIPAGASAVRRVELTSESAATDGSRLVTFTASEAGDNIIRRGENQKAGELLMRKRVLAAQDIGVLASSGYASLPVAARPVVGVVSTGDELVVAGETLADGLIYDSNGPQLVAQARAAGAEARYYGIVRDDGGSLSRLFGRAMEECDVLIVSGGVSMGDFDHVPRALLEAGVEPRFHGLAMRPGKPTFFGTRDRTAVFGLPGNPVSTFVNFEVLVRAHLMRRMGLSYEPRIVPLRLASGIERRETDRVEFYPARVEAGSGGLVARPLAYHGSSMLSVLAESDCLVRMELGEKRLEEGRIVNVRLVRP